MSQVRRAIQVGSRLFVPAFLRRAVTTAHGRWSTRLIPPPHLHDVGRADFATVGDIHLKHFTDLCGLREDDRVLDIGAGTGRIARPLTRALKTGAYHGLEIVEESVHWCRLAYRRYPNFDFQHANIRNSVYNPGGTVSAADYRFPFAERTITFAILTSVFTHMLPTEIENYLAELARVLSPGGRAFATFFLLNDVSRHNIRRGVSAMQFGHRVDRSWHERAASLEVAVAYDEADMMAMCDQAGLRVSQVYHGSWSGGPPGVDWQDIVMLQRKAGASLDSRRPRRERMFV
jgi:SAM-dependent methyltransferase